MNTPTSPRGGRVITDHHFLPGADPVQIVTLGDAGPGGAHHVYGVSYALGKPGDPDEDREAHQLTIHFQNGPLREAGVNGLTEASLLAIVLDRLRSFQAGPHSSRENALAITFIEMALMWLHHRTRSRAARGVEGTSAA